ncbi:MAG: Calx-beta domain-containing protein [Kineosporiaceae bacterium]
MRTTLATPHGDLRRRPGALAVVTLATCGALALTAVPSAAHAAGSPASVPQAPVAAAKPAAAPVAGAPSAPRDVVAKVTGDGQVTISWQAPADPGATPLRSYQVVRVGWPSNHLVKPDSTGALPTSHVWRGFRDGDSPEFVVRARNKAGWSAESAPSAPLTIGAAVTARMDALDYIFEGTRDERRLVRVSLLAAQKVPVTARVRTTAEGSATPGSDFEPLDATVTFAPGVTEQFVPLQLVDDTVAEETETVGLEVTSEQLPSAPSPFGEILDDDADRRVVYVDRPESVEEGDEGPTDLGMVLRLSQPAPSRLQLLPVIMGANLAQLYRPTAPVTIEAGATSVPLGLAVRGDRIPEGDLRVGFSALLGLPSGWWTASDSRVLVRDDDAGKVARTNLALVSTPRGAGQGSFDATLTKGQTWVLTTRNKTAAAVSDAEILVTAHLGPDEPAVTLSAPASCEVLATFASPVEGRYTAWRCPLGDLAKGAQAQVTFSHDATGTRPAYAYVEAFLAWPGMDDPGLANNLLYGRLGLVSRLK